MVIVDHAVGVTHGGADDLDKHLMRLRLWYGNLVQMYLSIPRVESLQQK